MAKVRGGDRPKAAPIKDKKSHVARATVSKNYGGVAKSAGKTRRTEGFSKRESKAKG